MAVVLILTQRRREHRVVRRAEAICSMEVVLSAQSSPQRLKSFNSTVLSTDDRCMKAVALITLHTKIIPNDTNPSYYAYDGKKY